MNNPRVIVTALTLSAAAFVGIATSEGYTDRAVIPTRGDVPTLGLGSTTHEDGRAVRMGDTTTPVKAIQRTLTYMQKDESDMRRSLDGVALHQAEYDVYMDWRYQYGATKWRNSSMLRDLRAGNYTAACNDLLEYKFSAGYDCSTPGNKVCAGVWTRQLKRHAQCMGAQ
ncbi:lysozyme [Herminiimonas sp. CN]|uniref:glycoside hydrolase family protein n=1 Tax=Herminiimonas sp. CN TaxID=1349818 RepID=UPI00047430D0|nr:lysozyme [Herminiimonas sp. CN]